MFYVIWHWFSPVLAVKWSNERNDKFNKKKPIPNINGRTNSLLPDTMHDHFPSLLEKCLSKLRALLRFRRIRLKISDFPERKITRNRATDCKWKNIKQAFGLYEHLDRLRDERYLGIAQMPTNKFQLWNRNPSSFISTSNGMMIHAIPTTTKKGEINKITPGEMCFSTNFSSKHYMLPTNAIWSLQT